MMTTPPTEGPPSPLNLYFSFLMTRLFIGLHFSIGSIGEVRMKSQLSWISAADSNCILVELHPPRQSKTFKKDELWNENMNVKQVSLKQRSSSNYRKPPVIWGYTRQASSSRHQLIFGFDSDGRYLSNSTKRTTNTETAMLSRLFQQTIEQCL